MKPEIHCLARLVVVLALLLRPGWAAEEFSPEKAKRVDDLLNRIARRQPTAIFLKKATFSEEELNAYLNLIYLKKYVPEATAIRLQLKEKNQTSGIIKIKLNDKEYAAVPAFLRDVEVRFSGRIDCANYRLRFLFEELAINGTRFSPEILDEAFAAAQINASEKKSLFDWFTLLPGLKRIQLDDKKVTFFY